MTREIKFRAWDKESKEMYFVRTIRFPKYTEKVISKFRVWLDGGNLSGQTKSTMELMQYTALKDKNGKEIFEGDIIENDSERYEIVWDEEQLLWLAQSEYPVYLSELGNKETFILGNIYENPELLKEI